MSFFMDAFQSIRDYFFPDSIGITSEVTQNEEVSQLETESLIAHNRYRSLHNVPPLRLSDALTTKAKDRAMYLASIKKLSRSNDASVGENVYISRRVSQASPLTADELVKVWYDESKKYSFSSPKPKSNTAHFTQIIWKDSTEIGIACVYNKSTSEFYSVAIYSPPGNVIGRFQENVFPPSLT